MPLPEDFKVNYAELETKESSADQVPRKDRVPLKLKLRLKAKESPLSAMSGVRKGDLFEELSKQANERAEELLEEPELLSRPSKKKGLRLKSFGALKEDDCLDYESIVNESLSAKRPALSHFELEKKSVLTLPNISKTISTLQNFGTPGPSKKPVVSSPNQIDKMVHFLFEDDEE